jgi:hypothetical protein
MDASPPPPPPDPNACILTVTCRFETYEISVGGSMSNEDALTQAKDYLTKHFDRLDFVGVFIEKFNPVSSFKWLR